MSLDSIRTEARSINNSFQEVERKAWDEIFKATGSNNNTRAEKLHVALEKATKKKNEALARLRKALRSPDKIKKVTGELGGLAEEARGHLKAVRDTADMLKTLAALAKVAERGLTILAKII